MLVWKLEIIGHWSDANYGILTGDNESKSKITKARSGYPPLPQDWGMIRARIMSVYLEANIRYLEKEMEPHDPLIHLFTAQGGLALSPKAHWQTQCYFSFDTEWRSRG